MVLKQVAIHFSKQSCILHCLIMMALDDRYDMLHAVKDMPNPKNVSEWKSYLAQARVLSVRCSSSLATTLICDENIINVDDYIGNPMQHVFYKMLENSRLRGYSTSLRESGIVKKKGSIEISQLEGVEDLFAKISN